MNIFETIEEIEKFSIDILTIGEPLAEEVIANFEMKYNLSLPKDYKELLKKHNGINLYGTEIYGIIQTRIAGLASLEENYLFEHYKVENEMPLYLVPFSPDGGGNHYCFDTRFNNDVSCPIVFWQHDYLYSEEDSPEVTNTSLVEWIKREMIDWTLEDYNYDGTEK